MKELANGLAIQHLLNAYAQETGKGIFLRQEQQNSIQLYFSQGLSLLLLPLHHIQSQILVPLLYVSYIGRHRFAKLPQIFNCGKLKSFSPISIASLLFEELVRVSEKTLDATNLVQRWAESRDALLYFLEYRQKYFDDILKIKQNFIESEQALILGHSMHPTPKSRVGFIKDDWEKYSPEVQAKIQLVYWLIAPEYIAEDSAFDQCISQQLKQEINWDLSESEKILFQQYKYYKLLPLHPWQARYLQGKEWFKFLKKNNKLVELGEKGWELSPTTSVRTLASFSAPWMFKLSLSVMITNSVRVNQVKECYRGQISCRLWYSKLGKKILKQCPTLKALHDPAWIALKIDDKVIDETICIFRDQPFTSNQQVTCIASLCQDHPVKELNRFNTLFNTIQSQYLDQTKSYIARHWFNKFLDISLVPLMYLYHEYGMAFELHQQNMLLELDHGMPQYLWLRDTQGFYYIAEQATEVLDSFPELVEKADAVGSQDFVDEKFSYYFFGNTLFGIINAIGITQFIDENELIILLQQYLLRLFIKYPESTLLKKLLHNKYLPYKGNLLTRLHELDELVAPIEQQSIYIQRQNPLYLAEQGEDYA